MDHIRSDSARDVTQPQQDHGTHVGAVTFGNGSARSPQAVSFGALAVGTCALGATAIGALAVGRVTIGALRLKRGRVGSLVVEDLTIDRLHVRELVVDGQND